MIYEMIDNELERLEIVKEVPSQGVVSYSGNVPFFHVSLLDIPTPDQKDPAGEALLLADLEKMRFKMTKLGAAMPYTRRGIDADEVWFIHRGSAKLFTELGSLDIKAGLIVFIARGVGYRVIPEGQDFMALILESEETIRRTPLWERLVLAPTYPDFPMSLPSADGQLTWEERLVTKSWTANIVRSYDPLKTKALKTRTDLVYAINVKEAPLELLRSPVLAYNISQRIDPLRSYHRNTKQNELYFVHLGVGGHDTDLGYVKGVVGSFYNLPRGIQHTVVDRQKPSIVLLLETSGEVKVNPEILGKK
jgi:homogentisate 1,2-dioxygenase